MRKLFIDFLILLDAYLYLLEIKFEMLNYFELKNYQ